MEDTNDNAPAFDEPGYSIEVDEDQVRGAVVGAVHATDPDKGANGLVSYNVISDWANDVFSLNPATGVFTLAARLDYEQVKKEEEEKKKVSATGDAEGMDWHSRVVPAVRVLLKYSWSNY